MSRIAIIGSGHVGGAFFRCLSRAYPTEDPIVCDIDEERLAGLGARHTTRDAAEAARQADLILIAVKPQSFPDLVPQLAGRLEGKLVVTIMAGPTLRHVATRLGCNTVIRAMPNLGAQIGRSATAWIAMPGCPAERIALARRVFRAAGVEFEVQDERLLDAFTALAGSGPAYFFLLAELLAGQAVDMGFPQDQAEGIAREVLAASAGLLDGGTRSAAEWKRAVVTPGGTTDAALRTLEKRGFAAAFGAALDAARRRSEHMGGE